MTDEPGQGREIERLIVRNLEKHESRGWDQERWDRRKRRKTAAVGALGVGGIAALAWASVAVPVGLTLLHEWNVVGGPLWTRVGLVAFPIGAALGYLVGRLEEVS